jgi:hypothetical protein
VTADTRDHYESNPSERDYLMSVYFEGCAYFLTRGERTAKSAFGGQPPFAMPSIPETILAADKLHYVGHVSSHDIPPLARHLSAIPLFYGFTFDGCLLRYEVESQSKVNLLDLSPPRPSADFPYTNYPDVFPRIPLKLGRKKPMTYRAFSSAYPNLEDDQPADVIVAVPPVSAGISLWGKYGDLEDVTVVFEYSLRLGTVSAYNCCT